MVNFDNLALQRAFGVLLYRLDKDNFWLYLTRLISEHVHFDSWVVLCFESSSSPYVLAECKLESGKPDLLFADYLAGLYLLDPFYIGAIEKPREGLVMLDEVAPDRFRDTDYYTRYFRLNVGEDELQINCLLPNSRTLCLSLGSRQRFGSEYIVALNVISQWLVPLMRLQWQFVSQAHFTTLATQQPILSSLKISFAGAQLSVRELEISKLILSGNSSKVIAGRLGIAPDTVKVHRKHIYSKLAINSQAELFSLFMKETIKQRDTHLPG